MASRVCASLRRSPASPMAIVHGLWIMMKDCGNIRTSSQAMAVMEAMDAARPSTTQTVLQPFADRSRMVFAIASPAVTEPPQELTWTSSASPLPRSLTARRNAVGVTSSS